jgi:hypothetical protein
MAFNYATKNYMIKIYYSIYCSIGYIIYIIIYIIIFNIRNFSIIIWLKYRRIMHGNERENNIKSDHVEINWYITKLNIYIYILKDYKYINKACKSSLRNNPVFLFCN